MRNEDAIDECDNSAWWNDDLNGVSQFLGNNENKCVFIFAQSIDDANTFNGFISSTCKSISNYGRCR